MNENMKYKEEEGTPLRMIRLHHHLPLGFSFGKMEQLDPKVAMGMSLGVGWNYPLVPWMDKRGELAMQRLVQQHFSSTRSVSNSIDLGLLLLGQTSFFPSCFLYKESIDIVHDLC